VRLGSHGEGAVEGDGAPLASAAVGAAAGTEGGNKGEEEAEEEKEEPFDMEGYLLDGAPEDYICPLSLFLFEVAVIAQDGITYSRHSIQAHVDFCKEKGKPLMSPMTGEMMEPTLVPNVIARRMVSEYGREKEMEVGRKRKEEEGGGGRGGGGGGREV